MHSAAPFLVSRRWHVKIIRATVTNISIACFSETTVEIKTRLCPVMFKLSRVYSEPLPSAYRREKVVVLHACGYSEASPGSFPIHGRPSMLSLSGHPTVEEEMAHLLVWCSCLVVELGWSPSFSPPFFPLHRSHRCLVRPVRWVSFACHLGSPRSYLGMADCTNRNRG